MERSNNGDVTQGWKHPKIAVGMQEENHLPTVKRGSILKSSMASPKINTKPEKMCHSSSGNFTKFSELPIFLGLSTLGGDAGVVVPWRCLRTGWWWKTSGEISKLVKNHCWEELRFRFVPFFWVFRNISWLKNAWKSSPFWPADELVKFGKPEWGHPTYCCLARIQGPGEGFQGSHDEAVWWFKTF